MSSSAYTSALPAVYLSNTTATGRLLALRCVFSFAPSCSLVNWSHRRPCLFPRISMHRLPWRVLLLAAQHPTGSHVFWSLLEAFGYSCHRWSSECSEWLILVPSPGSQPQALRKAILTPQTKEPFPSFFVFVSLSCLLACSLPVVIAFSGGSRLPFLPRHDAPGKSDKKGTTTMYSPAAAPSLSLSLSYSVFFYSHSNAPFGHIVIL